MCDLETISLAIAAAETGHLVFATLHTNSAVKTIDRVIEFFPERQQIQIRVILSESLRGVVAQALLPRPDHQGRVPVVEILVDVPAVANLICEGKTHQIASAMQTGRTHGMMSFEVAVQDLIQKGLMSKRMACVSSAGEALASNSPAPEAVVNSIRLANSPACQSKPLESSRASCITTRCQALRKGKQ